MGPLDGGGMEGMARALAGAGPGAPEDGALVESIRQACPELGEIEESSHNDYRFRARGPKGAVGAALARLAKGIDYDNFKAAVGARQGHGRAEVYHGVWDVLYALQRGGGLGR